ncbi:hypothetical protein MNBD_UNCLBAC01-1201 [hydrothermal vent metagenome]|uniref:HEPN domain-containing protein n=1 Tax=hydrothermal vent metagenome TaxID=652676 RepID=A0A3B1DKX7_9ZZZZ
MMKKDSEKITQYWIETAKHDFKTMQSLFESKRYSDSLFFGHIVLEKILKALVSQHKKNHAPPIHDLLRLQKMTDIELNDQQLDLLDEVNDYNIRARYPDYKLEFYKICTKIFVQKRLKKITTLYKELCQKMK